MALRLLAPDETKDVSFSDTHFRVRKLPYGVSVALTRKHTERGRFNEDSFAREMWPRVLAGWTGLLDAKGAPIPYVEGAEVDWTDPVTGVVTRESLAFVVAMSLPGQVAELLLLEARTVEIQRVEEALGNSAASSAAG